jgi:hypothetical protein
MDEIIYLRNAFEFHCPRCGLPLIYDLFFEKLTNRRRKRYYFFGFECSGCGAVYEDLGEGKLRYIKPPNYHSDGGIPEES